MRSVFIEWPTAEAAGAALPALFAGIKDYWKTPFSGDFYVPPVSLLNVTVFGPEDDGDGKTASVYFVLAIDHLSEVGRADELAFIAAAEALGGDYTGS